MKNEITTSIKVYGIDIKVLRVGNEDYLSLTDLAKYANNEDPSGVIRNWMSNKNSFLFYSLWEELNNLGFNSVESHRIKINEVPYNRFTMTPNRWKRNFNSIGIIPGAGKSSIGTFAHPDIALEFASWLSPEFKLYLIQEFQRLKKDEAYQNKLEWNINRTLSKLNYLVHTDAIKTYLVPTLTDKQIHFIYAEEADVINVALFGMTAKEWRENNPELAKTGNIRDYTDLLHLIILNNLEISNSEYIKSGLTQSERLVKLNNTARNHMKLFMNNQNLITIQKE